MRRLMIVVGALFVAFSSAIVIDVVGGEDDERRDVVEPVLEARVEDVTESVRRAQAFREGLPVPGERGDGVVFRAVVDGGPMVSLEEDGRVVFVWDTSVTSSTDDHQTLRLDDAGTEQLAAVVFESLLEPGDETGVSVFHGDGRVNPARAAVGDRLRGLVWLEEHIVEPMRPWVPDELSIEAHPPLGSPPSPVPEAEAFAPWPLSVRIEDLPHEVIPHPYGERRAICLVGDDVAPVFALLTGVNHAYLRVDDGQRWELNVTVHSPGYRIHGSACERAL